MRPRQEDEEEEDVLAQLHTQTTPRESECAVRSLHTVYTNSSFEGPPPLLERLSRNRTGRNVDSEQLKTPLTKHRGRDTTDSDEKETSERQRSCTCPDLPRPA